MSLQLFNKGYRKHHKHLSARAWLAVALLLCNQLAQALHAHDPDDHVRVHECATCMQLQSGEHAVPVNHDFRLPERFEDIFHSLVFNAAFLKARLTHHPRAPPVALG